MASRTLSRLRLHKSLAPGAKEMSTSIEQAVATAQSSSGKPKLTYYSAWFCPFAHRTTLALERHRGHVAYDWVEALGWEKRSKTQEEIATKHENWYHFKHPDLMTHNPLGMVPTLVDSEEHVITESITAIEYVDELVHGGDDSIMAQAAHERAQERVWAGHLAKTACSKYYGVLVRQMESEQLEAFGEIEAALEKFATMLPGDGSHKSMVTGPFFNGREHPGLVDLTLFPWAWRFPVFETYRDARFKIDPDKSPGLAKYTAWLAAMGARDDVARTLPVWDEYLDHIGRYADGSARSKVANAVRDGREAHQYDDEKDDVKE